MSQAKICPQCGKEYPGDQRFCPSDGATLRLPGGSADLVGSIIADRYHVVRKLGEGGMGQVYLAEHVKMGRRCALKVMNPAMVKDADAISRFNREAANASRINHPNAAAVYDFGETSEGVIYLAMELVEGSSLTELIERQGALPPLRAADIARQVSEALTVAHDLGIVHRDLKPDNVMIARTRDGGDLVKVVDFGIAKAAQGSAQKVTQTGLVVGTPEYMSPEQLAGDRLDGRSDIYALALVTFSMLTGRLPFPAETAQESMIMRLTDAPKRLAEMKGDVAWTPEVQAVLDRGMAREASKRYATAVEFGRELLRAVQAMPEAATAGMATQVIGGRGTRDAGRAGDSHTITSLVPPTRVAAADRREDARRGRGGVLTGIAALVILTLGGLGAVVMRGHAPRGAASVSQQGTAAQVAAAPQTRVAKPAPNEKRDVPHGGTRAAEHGAAGAASIAARLAALERLTDPSQGADAGTARHALAALDSLAPSITAREDDVHAKIIRAEARMALEENAAACDILKGVEAEAMSTTRKDRVTYLVGYACQ